MLSRKKFSRNNHQTPSPKLPSSQPNCYLTPIPRGTPRKSAYLISLETIHRPSYWLKYLPLIVWVYLHANFCGGLRKTQLFYKSAYMGRSISLQGHWFWYESKARTVCDFLLIHHCNLGTTLPRFTDTAGFLLRNCPARTPIPRSTLWLGVFPLDQIADVGSQPEPKPQANQPWNYFRSIPTCVISIPEVNVSHRLTVRRTVDVNVTTAQKPSSNLLFFDTHGRCVNNYWS